MKLNILILVKKIGQLIFLAIIVTFNINLFAQQVQYLLNPSRADLVQLAKASVQLNTPIALPFVYNKTTFEYYMGIPLSNRIRNGVHGRLLVENRIVSNLAEAKSINHGYEAGTLFLELNESGEPVLSVHERNSYISSINKTRVRYNSRTFTDSNNNLMARSNTSGITYIPIEVFQKISNNYQLPVLMASDWLFNRINSITALKYSKEFVISYFKEVDLSELLTEPIYPNKSLAPQTEAMSSPDFIDNVLVEREKQGKAIEEELLEVVEVKRNLGLSKSAKFKAIMCKVLFIK